MRKKLRPSFVAAAWIGLAAGIVLHGAVVPAQPPELTPAQRQRLEQIRHRILEGGVIESADVVRIQSEVPGQATILSVVEDGATVKQGDLLVKLDDSALQETLAEQLVATQQAEAVAEQAAAALEAARRTAKRCVPVRKLALDVAKSNQQRHLADDGQLNYEARAIDREISLARRQLETLQSLDKDTLRRHEAQLRLDSVLEKKTLFEKHVRPHETADLKLAVARAEERLLQQQVMAAQSLRDATTTLDSAKLALELEQAKAKKLTEQIRSCTITAPRDGVVLHAVAGGRRAATGLEAGAKVNQQQTLIEMPNLDRLRASVLVNESQIARVKPGQPVTLRVDALPGSGFSGKVVSVNSTPEPRNFLNANTVEYKVRVELIDPPPAVKIGMTLAAEIKAD